jgi:2-iminobutanoate/2-iminopropanoate deaminase
MGTMEEPITTIATEGAPLPIGPYAQAVVANGFVFCSGIAGVDPRTQALADGLENQVRQTLDNLGAILAAAASDFARVVQVSVYLHNMDDFARMNALYVERFDDHLPARTCVEVSRLAKPGALVVMDLIALAS